MPATKPVRHKAVVAAAEALRRAPAIYLQGSRAGWLPLRGRSPRVGRNYALVPLKTADALLLALGVTDGRVRKDPSRKATRRRR